MNNRCTWHILNDQDPMSVEACTLVTHGLHILFPKKFQCVWTTHQVPFEVFLCLKLTCRNIIQYSYIENKQLNKTCYCWVFEYSAFLEVYCGHNVSNMGLVVFAGLALDKQIKSLLLSLLNISSCTRTAHKQSILFLEIISNNLNLINKNLLNHLSWDKVRVAWLDIFPPQALAANCINDNGPARAGV